VRAIALALALGAGLLVVGCGGSGNATDREQITKVLTSYYKAFGSGDSATACADLAKATRDGIEKASGGKGCTEVLDAALKRPDYARIASKLDGARIEQVTIVQDKATARILVPELKARAPVALKKENGTWKIASSIAHG
jgi:ABC-type microcin C transport system duplicated ATPase subunit YejF